MKAKVLYILGTPVLGSLLISAASLVGCGSDDDTVAPPASTDGGATLDATSSSGGDPGGGGSSADAGRTASDGGVLGDAALEDAGDAGPEALPPFEFHHQPFVYFKNWGGTGGVVEADGGVTPPNGKWAVNHNLKDEADFLAAAQAGTLPAVSFVKPLYDEHPNYTTETDSQNHTVELINAVASGPSWASSVIVITYDENGGHADHVPPPSTATGVADSWGPGTRVPGIVISPFAKGGVDSTSYDTTAILTLIEKRWSLDYLDKVNQRDLLQSDLSSNAMSFGASGSLATSIDHIVVIYLENHSFDSLFGEWEGAEGLQKGAVPQVGPDGGAYAALPEYGPYPASAESLEDASIPNGTFDFTTYFQEGSITNDLLHRFYQEQLQINGGKMDSYVLWNDESAGQSMGHWPTASLPVAQWMKAHPTQVTLCDHFFHAAFGGSFLNHFWLIGSRSPVYLNPPQDAGLVAMTNAAGLIDGVPDTTSVPPGEVFTSLEDGELTPPMSDGKNYAVNTAFSVNEPHPSSFDGVSPTGDRRQLIPQQTWATIADRLDDANQTWAWYAGGWNAAAKKAGIPVESDGGT